MLSSRHYVVHSRPRFLTKGLLIAVLISLPATSALLVSPPAATLAGECDCKKLEDLQLELRNAMKLKQAFTSKIAELRAMSNRESAAMEFKRFAESSATSVTRPASDKGPQAIDYISRGENVSPDDRGRVIGANLCDKSASAIQGLHDLRVGAACDGIYKAVVAHEDYHQGECVRLSYMVYREKHPADRAAEEAAAYGAQIAVLRAEIQRVLEKSKIRIEAVGNVRATVPPNPLYTNITIDTKSKVEMHLVPVTGDLIKFEGQGDHTVNAAVDGNCTVTSGVPYTVVSRGNIETDGLEAQLRFTIEGTTPGLGMKCQIKGGTGSGMSMPLPIKPDKEATANLALRNGAEVSFDQANSPAAKMLAQGGVKLSGTAAFRLFIECPK